MVTVPPCGVDMLKCCTTMRWEEMSKSWKRRLRDRRVAVRRSQQTSVALRTYLLEADDQSFLSRVCSDDGSFHWSAAATCFWPRHEHGTCVEKGDVALGVAIAEFDCSKSICDFSNMPS